jgi:formylglycine-generating enzyme required for sulfatase activity
MAGNVWEWVEDRYAADYYASAPTMDPRGPSEGDERVQRGGGWTSEDPIDLRSSGRMSMAPDQKVNDVGVRCVWGARGE